MKDIKYWIGFSKIYSIGTIHFRKLMNHFGNVQEAWNATAGELLEVEGLSSKLIEKFTLERNSIECLDKLVEDIENKGINLITLNDESYPYYLKQIYDPPILLYCKGNLKNIDLERCLAVVGSRKASHYIKEVLKKILFDLKGNSINIVSGMAVGVDSCAHRTALDNELKTIGVIGSGLDNIYPSQNKKMAEEIVNAGGVIISEYFPTEKASPWKFPRRNRIISGLSQGTLVAEAGLKSGALITANLCLEQNRELMCIPGMITNPNTEGTHYLIKNGAGVVTSGEDIFNCLSWTKIQKSVKKTSDRKNKFLDNEEKIYDILDLEPKTFDLILEESKLNVDELMTVLTTMEINGLITQLPGQKFSKTLCS